MIAYFPDTAMVNFLMWEELACIQTAKLIAIITNIISRPFKMLASRVRKVSIPRMGADMLAHISLVWQQDGASIQRTTVPLVTFLVLTIVATLISIHVGS